ncbi:sulfatase-like hydrolase/transferase [Legionella cardiaca]|uniref:Sulfatase-like hydrolase/transferase n=1 Tax=Legionella cardiaca TaxID=1071983 RepID=A0ABY8ARX7_9GAMM|nr:sulfatase-like hydrolase/transferase [Legionella cardiaca]WED42519.1 sulfatase-like hydrolase/transferase [Legionella cardiaca]
MKTNFFRHAFTHFALFNLIFLILQFIYVLAQGGSFLKAIPLPFAVHLQIAMAALIQLGLYLCLTILQTFWLWGLKDSYLEKPSLEFWLLIIYFLSLLTILSLNCYFFPLSLFSRLFLPEISIHVIQLVMIACLLGISLLMLKALLKAYLLAPVSISALLGAISLLFFMTYRQIPIDSNRQSTQPNIIIIGVDSLSPERINKTDTPNLNQFISNSAHFKEAISPLARTYSAWASILTGLYPLHHQARYNLMPAELVKSSKSIAWTMQNMGYQTIFATDERRFSTIDKDFGFQTIVGPQLGVNDILLGTFYDFPLSNFLINLPISRWLFPYNYLNRASHFSYYPNSFSQALENSIAQSNPQKPLFLAVHFAIPHWPYAWAASSPAEVGDIYSVKEREGLYFAAIHEADKQVGLLLNYLRQAGLLENSMVIILSDHGESLYESGSRKTNPQKYQGTQKSHLVDYFKRKTSTELEMSAGHGSDLLSPSQFHCLLAFNIYNKNQQINPKQEIGTRVALIDLAPTIFSFLNLPLRPNFDGISLFDAILNKQPLPEKRIFILESGELPNQIVSRERARVLGKLLYEVNFQNNQLQIRKERLPLLDALKLYGILEGEWLVALYPDDSKYITVILNLNDGQWTDDLNSSFAKSSPVGPMLKQLLEFYQKELSSYPKSKVTPNLLE